MFAWKPATPVEPIAAIVDAFRSHRIVALGDNHGNEQVHAFRLSLIRDPMFTATVDDIVVEFGSARYQHLMDRFVHGGDVPYESLRQVWQNTTQPEYEWDLPIYKQFLLAAEPPDTPAGRTLAAWLEAFNSADRAKLKAFLDVHVPKGRVEDVLEYREETGGFDLLRITKSEPTELTALVRARETGNYAELTLHVRSEPPHRTARLALKRTPRPADIPAPPRLTEAEALAGWKAEIDKRAAADQFSGAVLLAKNGKVLFSQAYGLTDREKGLKNALDTQFRLGSMNKMFTAVATLRLVQADKLALEDPLVKHLPDYPDQNWPGR